MINNINSNNTINKLFKHQHSLAFLLYILITIIFFWSIIFGNQSFFSVSQVPTPIGPFNYNGPHNSWNLDPVAFVRFEMVQMYYTHDKLREGFIPYWCPYGGAGYANSSDMLSQLYSPLTKISLLGYDTWVINLYQLIKNILAAFFIFGFLKILGLNFISAFIGGIIWGFGGYFMNWSTLWHLNVDMLTGAVFWTFEYLYRNPRRKMAIAVSILAVAASILNSHAEVTPFLLAIALMYFVVRFFVKDSFYNKELYKKHITNISIVLAGGVIISLPLIIDFVIMFFNSVTLHDATGIETYSFPSILSYFFSAMNFLDNNTFSPYAMWGRNSETYILNPYVGFLSMFLVFCCWNKNHKYKYVIYLLAIYSLIWILKTNGGFLTNWIGTLPFFDKILFGKYSGVLYFNFAVLAALGIQNIIDKNFSKKVFFIATGVLVCILIGSIIYNPKLYTNSFTFEKINFDNLVAHSTSLYNTFVLPFYQFLKSIGSVFFFLGIILSVIIIYFSAKIYADKGKMVIIYILSFLVVLELYIYAPRLRTADYDIYEPKEYITFLQDKYRTQGGRIFSLDNGIIGTPLSWLFQIEDNRNITATYPAKYFNYMKNLCFNEPFAGKESFEFYTFLSGPLNPNVLSKPQFQLLNPRYILSGESMDLPLPNYQKLQRIAQNVFRNSIPLCVPESQRKGCNNSIRFTIPLNQSNEIKLSFKSILINEIVGQIKPVDRTMLFNDLYISISVNESEIKRSPISSMELDKWYNESIDISNYRGSTIEVWIELKGSSPQLRQAPPILAIGDIDVSPCQKKGFNLIYDKEFKIYENANAFEKAFIVHKAKKFESEELAFLEMKKPDFQFDKLITVDNKFPNELLECKGAPEKDNSTLKIDWSNRNPNKVKMSVNMENDGIVVLSDMYYPFWKANIDGESTEVYMANNLCKSIYVPKGKHEIEFEYSPTIIKISILLMILGTLFCIAVIIFDTKKKKSI